MNSQESVVLTVIPTRKKVVLVVEDYDTIRYLVRSMLEYAGYEVIVAEDGLQGWNIWFENRDRIDLVFSDLQMPRMRGDALLAKIKATDPSAKVAIYSGTATRACVPQADLIIKKPCSPDKITASISQLLAEHTPAF